MNIQNGIISLRPLSALAEADRTTGRYLAYRQDPECAVSLGPHIKSLCSSIPHTSGLYLWGHLIDGDGWKFLYIGRAAFRNRHSLRNKIAAELDDEKIIFWRKLYEERALITFLRSIGRFRDDGKASFRRSMIKSRATHIIWVQTDSLSGQDAARVESALIQRLRPEANTIRGEKPTPQSNAFTDALLHMLQALKPLDDA